MMNTLNLHELQLIVNAEHADPHVFLGMHNVDGVGLCVRVFNPHAKAVEVIDPATDAAWQLSKVHDDGFFAGVINGKDEWFRYKLKFTGWEEQVWETHDPYSFEPVISEFDRFLFAQGNHYAIYKKLGANLMEIDGVKGVLFAVWAPNAKRVSVVGSFNSWDGRRNVMRLLGEAGIWEIFIPGVCEFDEYKYEIITHAGVAVAKTDPYGNMQTMRPGTNSIVFDLDKYKWNDDAWYKEQANKNPIDEPMNIYEVQLGSWDKRNGKTAVDDDAAFLTYCEMADKLIPYVVDMGYTHIELMPILEHPFDGSWGYQVTGYFAATSRYGTPDEFMYFIDKCHQNGIGVILDWVPAHFPKDAHGLAKFDGTALYEHEHSAQGEHPEWGTLIFNYGRGEVKNFLISNALFWLKEFHIDGLRVDAVASMLYLDYAKEHGEWIPNKYGGNHNLEAVEFIKHMNSIVVQQFPKALMIAEESTSWANVSRPVEHDGLGFNLKWNMGWMNDFLAYVKEDPLFKKYHHNKMTFGSMYAYTENFVLVLSHDEVVHGKLSLLNKMPGDLWKKCANLRCAFTFMFGHPGKKLVFMGGEFGQFIEWDEKRPLDWFLLEYPHHKQIQDFKRDLNHLYKQEKAFWYDDFKGSGFEWIDADDGNRSLFSFMRKDEDGKGNLIFICNFTPNPIEDYRVGVPYNTQYREILNSDDEKYGGSGVINTALIPAQDYNCNNMQYSCELRVPPLGAVVLKPVF